MQAERWNRVEQLFHAALELEEKQRPEFLRQACAGDEDLRREAESLLAFGKNARNFIETPVFKEAAQALAMEHRESQRADREVRGLEGKTVSHYRVLEKLGGGGMGIVYKARDMKLGRFVALKFLPSDLAKDRQAIERFRREAHAASALNHRNICTIYDIDEYEVVPFIAMEFLAGRTLSHCIANKPLLLDQLLDLAIQISRALEAAHTQGIIHRDIKPANVFISNDGSAKILDFGVAKLVRGCTETAPASIMALGTASEDPVTSPGAVWGTLMYMSPEQVRGEELDARTDLFSLGVVLYEMATGQKPFTGNTSGVVVDAILNRAPIPTRQLNAALPPQLEEVVDKALEKDRKLRYQSAADIRKDLQRLKRDSDSGRAAVATAEGGAELVRKSARWMVVAGTMILVVGLAVGGWLLYSRKAHALTDKDVLVLADFTNTTGDRVFDGALRQGLAAQLEQSPFLSLVSEQQIQQTLRMMAQAPDVRLTPELAREVCQRTNSAAVFEGSIAQIGARYLLTLKAVNCSNGESLASTEAEASDKNQILDALGKAATDIRGKLGESLSTVQKFDTPLAQATTPSLEALQAYSLGWKNLVGRSDYATAVPFFQRAIQLDPNFAMAYASLGTSHSGLGETKLAAENATRAYESRERMSESERFYIECQYYWLAIGDLEKARRANELWAQTYPRAAAPRANLAKIASELGQYDKSLALLRESLLLDPGNAEVYAESAFNNLQLNRLQGARAAAEEAQAKKLDSPILRTLWYLLDFLQNDSVGMAQQVVWATDKPGWEDLMLYYDADTAAYFGRLGKAREISRRAVASAERAGENEIAADYEAEAALRESLFGNQIEARQRATAALRLFADGRDVQYGVALAMGFAGDTTRTQALANSLAEHFPDNTIVQFNYLPALHGQLALSRGDTSKALEALDAATPFELGMPGNGGFTPALYPVYVRGQAYLTARQGKEAAAEFQRIVDQSGIVQNEPIGALAHLCLARAYALQGDTSKARGAYRDFLSLWKDADPNTPVLKQATAEYANLR